MELCRVSRETLERLKVYAALLRRWQRSVNLVSQASIPDLWRRHILDSAQLADFLAPDDAIITDLGSGAGLPGLVLAIIAGRETHLVEANARKVAFLREAIRETAAPAIAHQTRIEALDPWPTHVVVARALAPVCKLLTMASSFPAPPGRERPACLFLKGHKVSSELTAAQKVWHMQAHLADSLSDPSGRILRVCSYSRVS